eukprot:CCRYP_008192-RA/>CCRYP_008192-RA protein AED:0.46 eAED:0.46 QI:83/1/1/1/0/0/2/92/41
MVMVEESLLDRNAVTQRGEEDERRFHEGPRLVLIVVELAVL